jgi:hypothetical protein
VIRGTWYVVREARRSEGFSEGRSTWHLSSRNAEKGPRIHHSSIEDPGKSIRGTLLPHWTPPRCSRNGRDHELRASLNLRRCLRRLKLQPVATDWSSQNVPHQGISECSDRLKARDCELPTTPSNPETAVLYLYSYLLDGLVSKIFSRPSRITYHVPRTTIPHD